MLLRRVALARHRVPPSSLSSSLRTVHLCTASLSGALSSFSVLNSGIEDDFAGSRHIPSLPFVYVHILLYLLHTPDSHDVKINFLFSSLYGLTEETTFSLT